MCPEPEQIMGDDRVSCDRGTRRENVIKVKLLKEKKERTKERKREEEKNRRRCDGDDSECVSLVVLQKHRRRDREKKWLVDPMGSNLILR